ncbi:MAG: hypothetical protein AAF939_01330 [Planctomycetota bacterium]
MNDDRVGELILIVGSVLTFGAIVIWLIAMLIMGIGYALYYVWLWVVWFFASGTILPILLVLGIIGGLLAAGWGIVRIVELQADHRVETFMKHEAPSMEAVCQNITNTVESLGDKVAFQVATLDELGEFAFSFSPMFSTAFFSFGLLEGHEFGSFGRQLEIETSRFSVHFFGRRYRNRDLVLTVCRIYQLLELRRSLYCKGRRLYKELANAKANTLQLYDSKTDCMKEAVLLKKREAIQAKAREFAEVANAFLESLGQHDLFELRRVQSFQHDVSRISKPTAQEMLGSHEIERQYNLLIDRINQTDTDDYIFDTDADFYGN